MICYYSVSFFLAHELVIEIDLKGKYLNVYSPLLKQFCWMSIHCAFSHIALWVLVMWLAKDVYIVFWNEMVNLSYSLFPSEIKELEILAISTITKFSTLVIIFSSLLRKWEFDDLCIKLIQSPIVLIVIYSTIVLQKLYCIKLFIIFK